MKKIHKKLSVRLASVVLAGGCLCGAALAAGGEKDPLITLSYLTQTATPEILAQVEKKTEEHQTKLLEQFNAAIDRYKGEQGGKSEGAEYVVVTLSKGQKLQLGLGCEVMLRVGSATLSAAEAPGLVDSTSGTTLGNGSALVANHLYLATMEGRVVTAADNSTKLMVRGTYTVG